MKYPEHEKLKKISDKSQAIGEFLDWCKDEENGFSFCRYREFEVEAWTPDEDGWYPCDFMPVLHEYFGIDKDKIEAEKCHMLEELRR